MHDVDLTGSLNEIKNAIATLRAERDAALLAIRERNLRIHDLMEDGALRSGRDLDRIADQKTVMAQDACLFLTVNGIVCWRNESPYDPFAIEATDHEFGWHIGIVVATTPLGLLWMFAKIHWDALKQVRNREIDLLTAMRDHRIGPCRTAVAEGERDEVTLASPLLIDPTDLLPKPGVFAAERMY
jgi:hypothetical protein